MTIADVADAVPEVPGWATAAGMLLTLVLGWLGKHALAVRHADAEGKRDDYKELFDRQEKQLAEHGKSIVTLLAQMGDLKAEHATCRQENASLKAENAETKQELAAARIELGEVRTELNQVRAELVAMRLDRHTEGQGGGV